MCYYPAQEASVRPASAVDRKRAERQPCGLKEDRIDPYARREHGDRVHRSGRSGVRQSSASRFRGVVPTRIIAKVGLARSVGLFY